MIVLAAEELPRTKTYEGFLGPAEEVDLRARTSGQIARVLVSEGSRVSAGQPLFRLDVAVQDARAAELAARLDRTRAALANALSDAERAERLLPAGAISVRDAEDARSEVSLLEADLNATQAALRAAQVERSYGVVRAPIAGRVGEILVDRGNLVSAGEGGTRLARIVSTDRLEVSIDMPEEDFLELSANDPTAGASVFLTVRPEVRTQARIDFTAPEIDRTSGTVRVKARLAGTPPGFLPGSFVRVEVPLAEPAPTLTVPEIAIGSDQDIRFVLVIDEDNVAQFRPITLGGRVGDRRIVEQGLSAGERVLVKGLVRAGMTVAPVTWQRQAESAPR